MINVIGLKSPQCRFVSTNPIVLNDNTQDHDILSEPKAVESMACFFRKKNTTLSVDDNFFLDDIIYRWPTALKRYNFLLFKVYRLTRRGETLRNTILNTAQKKASVLRILSQGWQDMKLLPSYVDIEAMPPGLVEKRRLPSRVPYVWQCRLTPDGEAIKKELVKSSDLSVKMIRLLRQESCDGPSMLKKIISGKRDTAKSS